MSAGSGQRLQPTTASAMRDRIFRSGSHLIEHDLPSSEATLLRLFVLWLGYPENSAQNSSGRTRASAFIRQQPLVAVI